MSTADELPAEALTARSECERLFLAFHGRIDAGLATRALELFTDDGVFEVRGQRHEGREAIAAFLAARETATDRRTRHLASNFHCTLDGSDRAHATANLTLFTIGADSGALELEAVVDCELAFILGADGVWRTRSRRHARFASTPTPPKGPSADATLRRN